MEAVQYNTITEHLLLLFSYCIVLNCFHDYLIIKSLHSSECFLATIALRSKNFMWFIGFDIIYVQCFKLLSLVLLNISVQYCNVDGQSGVFTVPCRANPTRATPGRTATCPSQYFISCNFQFRFCHVLSCA
jgi:hypothetical protein